ncbi:hypothetical protein Rsub_04048 [Raphidocelis subcapitata]|uniref:Uncharacterized protein n=1 Tax=Raphidocelis subcapitata TaxID=307507 RepID=A0A2V0NVS6_9CHLO|nr:hypothetical protein Rsub_04048 [Raphidocelis subcapitata]|eukprot:GBF91744.1 hypothetical protein Rsub_04048 [Raphidocelis subcapitata]
MAGEAAERRLGRLERLRAKLALLEARAGALDALDEARHALSEADSDDGGGGSPMLKAVWPAPPRARPRSSAPPRRAGGAAAAEARRGGADDAVCRLKQHLEAVLDADAGGGGLLADIAQRHCIECAVGIIERAGLPPLDKPERRLVDLAAATLCSLSQRASADELLLSAGAVPALVSLLSPCHSRRAACDATAAAGNLAGGAAARAALRAAGAVGALARLLRPDAAAPVQAAAAGALAALAAADPIVQDSVRYLGGIESLVEIVASPDDAASEAALRALSALQRGNGRNAEDVARAVRASPALARDYWRLRDAMAVLRPAPREAARAAAAAAEAEAEAEAEDEARRCRAALRALRSAEAADAEALNARLAAASADAARAAARAASVGRARPLSAASAASAAAAAATAAAAASAAAAAAAAARGRFGAAAVARPASPRRAARSPQGKHLLSFTCEEVCALLEAMGFDPFDLSGLRRARTTGAELCLDLAAAAASDPPFMALAAHLGLPSHKARRLRKLLDATALYDAVATRAAQPRLSGFELRAWLAGSGCSAGEVTRVMRLLGALVARDGGEADAVTFWEWCVGWAWVTHALEVYGVDWRAAL